MAHTSRCFGLGFSCPGMQPFSHLISLWAVHQSAVCRRAHQHPMLHCTAHAQRCPSATKSTERRSGTETLPCSHWVGEEKPSVGARLPAALQSFISCFILHASWIYLFHYFIFLKRPEVPCQHLASDQLSSSLPIQKSSCKSLHCWEEALYSSSVCSPSSDVPAQPSASHLSRLQPAHPPLTRRVVTAHWCIYHFGAAWCSASVKQRRWVVPRQDSRGPSDHL